MTKSQEVEAKEQRYNRIERESDEWGRIIGVKRLAPSEERRLKGMTADLSGAFDQIEDADTGKKVIVPAQWPMQLAAMVREVHEPGHERPGIWTFPASRKELDAIYDRLDQEGLAAAMKALNRLISEGIEAPPKPQEIIDEAKNS